MRGTLSARSLAREIRASDKADYGIDWDANREEIIRDAVEAASEPDRLADFNVFPVGKRTAWSYSDYGTVLVLRAIGTIIRRRYAIKMPDRSSMVRGIIQGLADATPFCVIRRDIRSFYENVPTNSIKNELLVRAILPNKVHRYLERFFADFCPGENGLPRGLSISAILAEWSMQDFDKAVWALPGVVRYYRFSDDILVFSTGEMTEVAQAIEESLPTGLEFGKAKSRELHYSVGKGLPKQEQSFDYLGYQFKAATGAINSSQPRTVTVSISPTKINRIRSRVIVSAKDLLRTGDAQLFLDRIVFLTGNHKVLRANRLVSTGQKSVKSGIYYNYRYCGVYKGGRSNPPLGTELKALDWFLHNRVATPKTPFGRVILSTLSGAQRLKLGTLSFTAGHSQAYQTRFNHERVSEIKRAWRNV